MIKIKPAREIVDPENNILSVLSPEDRFDAAFKIVSETFEGTKLGMKNMSHAVQSVRRKARIPLS